MEDGPADGVPAKAGCWPRFSWPRRVAVGGASVAGATLSTSFPSSGVAAGGTAGAYGAVGGAPRPPAIAPYRSARAVARAKADAVAAAKAAAAAADDAAFAGAAAADDAAATAAAADVGRGEVGKAAAARPKAKAKPPGAPPPQRGPLCWGVDKHGLGDVIRARLQERPLLTTPRQLRRLREDDLQWLVSRPATVLQRVTTRRLLGRRPPERQKEAWSWISDPDAPDDPDALSSGDDDKDDDDDGDDGAVGYEWPNTGGTKRW